MPGANPQRDAGDLPEERRLAEQRVRTEMKKFRTILEQIQEKLKVSKIDSVGKKDVQFFIKELIRCITFVQADENKSYVGAFLRSAQGLSTILEKGVKLQLDAALDQSKELEKLEKNRDYGPIRAGLLTERKERLMDCREPLDKAIKQFKNLDT